VTDAGKQDTMIELAQKPISSLGIEGVLKVADLMQQTSVRTPSLSQVDKNQAQPSSAGILQGGVPPVLDEDTALVDEIVKIGQESSIF
jgi:hypothetical protein